MTSDRSDRLDPAGTATSGRVIYITLGPTDSTQWPDTDPPWGNEPAQAEKEEIREGFGQPHQTRPSRAKQKEPIGKRVARRRARERNRKKHNKIIKAALKKKRKGKHGCTK